MVRLWIKHKLKRLKETVEINCRCKDCIHSKKEGSTLYCYFWDYEKGMSPNTVAELGFCNFGELPTHKVKA